MAEIIEENVNKQQSVKPTLSDLFKLAMDGQSSKMRVSCPGTVVKYDHKKQKADVKIDFKTKYRDGTVDESPIIYNVPVKHPRAGQSIVHMPLEAGDKVHLSFSDKSLEKWLTTGKEGLPGDGRGHNISDAFAYPGGYAFNDPADVNNGNDLIIKNKKRSGSGNLEIRLKKSGRLQILNHRGEELITVLNDMLTAIRQARVYTSTGAQLLRHSKFSSVQTRLKTFLQR